MGKGVTPIGAGSPGTVSGMGRQRSDGPWKYVVGGLTSAVVLSVLVVVVMGGVRVYDHIHETASERRCRILAQEPKGLDVIYNRDGIASVGAIWEVTLSYDLLEASDRSLRDVAKAVKADDAGYQRVLDVVPASAKPSVVRMHRLALDPDAVRAHRDDAAAQRDASTVAQMGGDCGWAP